MPTYGAHAFLWIGEWSTQAGNYAIEQAGAVGFDFIEIPLLKPHEFDVASHKAALRAAGIGCTASLVLPRGAHMAAHPAKAKAFLIAAMDRLAELGGSYLCGCLAYELGYLTGKPPSQHERAVVVETMREVAAAAQARGITLGFEVCNRYETYMYNVLADGRAAIQAIGAPNIELHGDTYHMNIEEQGLYQPIIDAGDVLGYMHMSESHRGLVGSGTVNWDQVFGGLAAIGYRGKLVLESFAAINPDLAAATCLWRPPTQGSDVLARAGLRFLRAHAERVGLA